MARLPRKIDLGVTMRTEIHMRRTPRAEETNLERRVPMQALPWLPAHDAVPSAAPMFKRCRRTEAWGRVSRQAR